MKKSALPVVLVAVLVAELVYLTVAYDTQILEKSPSVFAQIVGWAPQYLRLAITISTVILLLCGRQLLLEIRQPSPFAARGSRLPYLGAHGLALLLFIKVTSIVLGREFAAHPGAWTVAWFVAGATTLLAWSLALFPRQTWLRAVRKQQSPILWGLGVGTAIWAGGFLTAELWTPLARYTFAVVQWTLSFIYPVTVSDPSRLLIGTPRFKVTISPQCSGYEGIGLILAFLSIYLWLFRKDLRFPSALVLLPLGAAAIWVANALRIVALVVIGTSGWPAIARGGFHSQAGWLAFNAVALGFVALTIRGRYFTAAAAPPSASPIEGERDPTTAFLAPFVAITATAMLTGAFSAEAQDQVRAAEIAIKEFNDSGGFNGRKAELLVRDDKLNPGEAATRTLELIEKDKVNFVVGSLSAATQLSINAVCRDRKIIK